MSALDTELARTAAKHSLPAVKSNRQDGEVVATSTARATVLVGGQAHTVSTTTLPREVADGDTMTVEWGPAIPTAVAVRTPGSATPAVRYVPVGAMVQWWWGPPIPTGWLACNGSAVSSSTYPDLYGLLLGSNLPDLSNTIIRAL